MRSELKTYTNNPEFSPVSKFLAMTEAEQAKDGRPGMIQMLDGRPIFCVDILPVNFATKQFLLPTRTSKPAEGPWFIGGGLKLDQAFFAGPVAALKRETGLELAEDRFKPLALSRFVWDYRQEPPSDNGRVDVNLCFTVELTTEEIDRIALTSSEYEPLDGLKAYTLSDLKHIAEQNPAKSVFVDYYDYLFGNK